MILLDASAVLALLRDETGASVVADAIDQDEAALSVVNLAEVLEGVTRVGGAPSAVLGELRSLVTFASPTDTDALAAAGLWPVTRRPALSLADRLALAMARRLSAPVLTADRAWLDLDRAAVGAEVRLIR